MTDVTNHDDLIDVREVIERFEELEQELQDEHARTYLPVVIDDSTREASSEEDEIELIDEMREAAFPAWVKEQAALAGLEANESAQEFAQLRTLLDDMKGYGGDEQWRGDWYPITLVRDSYFQDHARELAEDIGAIKDDAQWPYTCIDWEQAAKELRMDYTSVEFGDVTYWYR